MILRPCPSCSRHVRTTERACPFCDAALEPAPTCGPCAPPRALTRAALVFAGATAATACVKTTASSSADAAVEAAASGSADAAIEAAASGSAHPTPTDTSRPVPPYGPSPFVEWELQHLRTHGELVHLVEACQRNGDARIRGAVQVSVGETGRIDSVKVVVDDGSKPPRELVDRIKACLHRRAPNSVTRRWPGDYTVRFDFTGSDSLLKRP